MKKEIKFCANCGKKLVKDKCQECDVSKELKYTKFSDISDKEKIKSFNTLYEMCWGHLKGHYNNRYYTDNSDFKQYIYEEVMGACLGKDIFGYLEDYEEYEFKEK